MMKMKMMKKEKDITWMRNYTQKNRIRLAGKSNRRNYKLAKRSIKRSARLGFNKAILHCMLYNETVRKLRKEGYKVEHKVYISGCQVWEVSW